MEASTEAELRELAALFREHAEAEEMSYAALIRAFPKLGSDKALAAFAQGKFDGYDLAKQLDNYREVAAALFEQAEADPLYEDLTTAKAVRGQITRLKLSRTNAKLVIVEGYTGAGKTSAGRIIADKYNGMSAVQSVFTIEASAGWGDRPNAMLAAMLRALGRDATGRSQAARLEKLEEVLSERPVMFIIDEVHDFGVRCLRVVKTLLNTTPVKIILLCHPRLFRDLERENWDDLSQLTGNRLLARIPLGSLSEADVLILLTRRLKTLSKTVAEASAKSLAEAALNHGNLAFVREVIVRLQGEAARGEALDAEAVAKAIRRELRARSKALKI